MLRDKEVRSNVTEAHDALHAPRLGINCYQAPDSRD